MAKAILAPLRCAFRPLPMAIALAAAICWSPVAAPAAEPDAERPPPRPAATNALQPPRPPQPPQPVKPVSHAKAASNALRKHFAKPLRRTAFDFWSEDRTIR